MKAPDLLLEARALERAVCMTAAIASYEGAIAGAAAAGEPAVLSEALRRLAIIRHRRGESVEAREMCRRSHTVALESGNDLLAAEALNTLGGIGLETDGESEVREHFLKALELGGESRQLRARVEQNLGILANIHGDFETAQTHYERSLEAYRAGNDEQGCAIAYHNLGMTSLDRKEFDAAERYFRQSREIALRAGDVYLGALCLVNHAKVHAARERYEVALANAEAALVIFDQVGAASAKADAYRVIGMVYRATERHALAESRLRSAIDLSVTAGSALNEAEASRELALLYQAMGRNQDALRLLNAARRLFRRLDARVDLVYVEGKEAELEDTYLAVVREWGQSIESADTYTYGHCERVARRAVAVAAAMGMDEHAQTTVRVGAYLHDVGKVRVPHEVLNKPDQLTPEEFEIVQQHTVWGIDLLAAVEFPWDIKPIIRWHHERYDGSGYPDRLRGDEIPLSAQIVGIADVYDALTTTRPYRAALPRERALAEMNRYKGWWSEAVRTAFRKSLSDSIPDLVIPFKRPRPAIVLSA